MRGIIDIHFRRGGKIGEDVAFFIEHYDKYELKLRYLLTFEEYLIGTYDTYVEALSILRTCMRDTVDHIEEEFDNER